MPKESSAPTVSQTVTTTGGNNKIRKVTLIVLAVVFLVIISEAGYLFFSKEGGLFPRKTEEAQIGQKPSVPITPTTPPPQPVSQTPKVLNSEKARIFADQLDVFVARNGLDLLEEAFIVRVSSGVVISIAFDKKEIDGVKYMYILKIKGPEGGEISYRLTDEEIINAQVTLADDTGTNKIPITNIKPGDNIILKETFNLLDSSPHSSLILEVRR